MVLFCSWSASDKWEWAALWDIFYLKFTACIFLFFFVWPLLSVVVVFAMVNDHYSTIHNTVTCLCLALAMHYSILLFFVLFLSDDFILAMTIYCVVCAVAAGMCPEYGTLPLGLRGRNVVATTFDSIYKYHRRHTMPVWLVEPWGAPTKIWRH